MTAPGILWLTRDFRFSDNPALLAAIEQGPLLPIFIVDKLLMAQGAASRWRLERALAMFDRELRRRTNGSGITVLRGEPDTLLPELAGRTGAKRVHQSDWPAPEMRLLQGLVRAALLRVDAELVLHPGLLLAHPQMVRTKEGRCYRVHTPFERALRSIGPDWPVREAPSHIIARQQESGGLDARAVHLAPDLCRGRDALETYALPAGEVAARDRLNVFLDRITGYALGRDRPDLNATSGLSEHLAVGEISPRAIWAAATQRAEADPSCARDIDKFLAEVVWREFAWHLLIDFPHMAEMPWREDWAKFPWRGVNGDHLLWRRGETGVALVDAGLREMRVTGRMHNRVRMVVASWLTKNLLTDWQLGLAHFADSLTDWDPASNAMNWQWVAGCGPDAAPYFRIFNPEKQAEQYDPDGRYRSRWLTGWMGETSVEAQAYLESVPTSWKLSQVWNARHAGSVGSGRDDALQAYKHFRTQIA